MLEINNTTATLNDVIFDRYTIRYEISELKSSITKLDLSCFYFYYKTNRNMEVLAEALPSLRNTNVIELILANGALCGLKTDGIKQVLSALKGTKVVSLDLTGNLLCWDTRLEPINLQAVPTRFEPINLQAVLNGLKNTDVTFLNLSSNSLHSLNDETLEQVFTGLNGTKVTTLILRENHLNSGHLKHEWLKRLLSGLKHTDVTFLDLSINDMGSYLIQFNTQATLTDLTGLEKTKVTALSLRDNFLNYAEPTRLNKFLSGLENTKVTFLDLSGNDLSSLGPEGLKQALSGLENTKVTTLILSRNRLDDLEPEDLQQALSGLKHTDVTFLDLSGNNLSRLGPKGLKQALSGLKNTKVTTLILSRNGLDALEPEDLQQALSALKDTNVTKLDLSGNNLSSLGPEGLKKALSELKNTKVTKLDLSDNRLSSLGPKGLKQALSGLRNTEVTELDLSGNYLDTPSLAKGLKKALSGLKNTKVTKLDLSGNNLSSLGPKGLKQALSGLSETKVTELDLSNNGPGLIGILLSTNTAFENIHTLTLSASDINSQDETELNNSLKKIFPSLFTLKNAHKDLIGRSKKIYNSTGDYHLFDEIQEHTRFPDALAAITMEYLKDEQIAESLKKDESSSKGKLSAKCFAILSLIHAAVMVSMILFPREILNTKITKASDLFKNKIFVITVALFIVFTIAAIAAVSQPARTNTRSKKRANVTGNNQYTPHQQYPK